MQGGQYKYTTEDLGSLRASTPTPSTPTPTPPPAQAPSSSTPPAPTKASGAQAPGTSGAQVPKIPGAAATQASGSSSSTQAPETAPTQATSSTAAPKATSSVSPSKTAPIQAPKVKTRRRALGDPKPSLAPRTATTGSKGKDNHKRYAGYKITDPTILAGLRSLKGSFSHEAVEYDGKYYTRKRCGVCEACRRVSTRKDPCESVEFFASEAGLVRASDPNTCLVCKKHGKGKLGQPGCPHKKTLIGS